MPIKSQIDLPKVKTKIVGLTPFYGGCELIAESCCYVSPSKKCSKLTFQFTLFFLRSTCPLCRFIKRTYWLHQVSLFIFPSFSFFVQGIALFHYFSTFFFPLLPFFLSFSLTLSHSLSLEGLSLSLFLPLSVSDALFS